MLNIVFKLAVRTRLHAGRAELLRTEIDAVFAGDLSFFRILKLLCYFGTYGMYTYGMYTYGMYTYGMYTYGMYT